MTKTTVVNEPTMGIALLGEGVGTSLKSTSGWYGGGNGTNKFGCDEAYFWSAATDDNLFAGRGVAGCPRSVG